LSEVDNQIVEMLQNQKSPWAKPAGVLFLGRQGVVTAVFGVGR
jgi:hypothetical protein